MIYMLICILYVIYKEEGCRGEREGGMERREREREREIWGGKARSFFSHGRQWRFGSLSLGCCVREENRSERDSVSEFCNILLFVKNEMK